MDKKIKMKDISNRFCKKLEDDMLKKKRSLFAEPEPIKEAEVELHKIYIKVEKVDRRDYF